MSSPRTCPISLSRCVKMVESGGASCECSMARAVFPTLGRQVRSAAMTEAQKRIGSLSNASSESQARAGSRPAARSLSSCREEAAHAERRVVFPLPAEAETSVKGWVQIASSSLSKRERSTRESGGRGGASLLESSAPLCSDDGADGSEARGGSEGSLLSTFATSSKRASVT